MGRFPADPVGDSTERWNFPATRRSCGAFAVVAVVAGALSGCGSGSSGQVKAPQVAPARTYAIVGFHPTTGVTAGRRVKLAFSIRTPSGATLTKFKKCCEPHSGVDLIIVRSDDSNVQYDDSDIDPDGSISQPVVFPAPGRYRVVVDAYPEHTGSTSLANFQLFTWVTVRGAYKPQPLPAFQPTQIVDGYRFQIKEQPHLKAVEPSFLTVKVTDPAGSNAKLVAWRGALAHAIFIHQGSLDYSHTHVCAPGNTNCYSFLGAARVTGRSTSPGILKIGVLLPTAGTWRLFLLTSLKGHVATAPFTLKVT